MAMLWHHIIKGLCPFCVKVDYKVSLTENMTFPWGFFPAFYSPGNKLTQSSVVTIESNVDGGLAALGGCPACCSSCAPKDLLAFFLGPHYTPVKSPSSVYSLEHIVLLWSTWYLKCLSLSSSSAVPLEQPFLLLNNFLSLLLYPLMSTYFKI